jgi:ribosomal protein L18E
MKSNVERSDIKEWVAKLGSVKRGEHNHALSIRAKKLMLLPKRSRVSVSVYRINKSTKDGETVFVPGKVLLAGTLGHKVRIAAVSYSAKAKDAIKASGSTMIGADELLASKKIRLIV